MSRMNRKAMLLCCAALPALAVSTAFGQDETDDGDVIVVRGIQKAIADSLETKKQSNSIIEAISAEDIGKLPDVSIADSLARLPGVTAQRVRGRAQNISIRGLGPDFSIALLNGREQVSTSNNRGIEFDQYPSELIASGLVYKSPDATLAATGIAGAVDLRTVRPLDYSDRRLNVSGRYVFNSEDAYNPDFDTEGYRFFGSYIDQFADGTLGVSLGVTVQSNPTQYTSRELKPGGQDPQRDPTTGVFFPQDNPRSGVVSRDFERTSIAGSLQWEPDDRFQATFDAFYTDTEDTGIFRGVETPLASWARVNPTVTDVQGSGFYADSATYTGLIPVIRTDTEGNEANILSLGLNTSYQFTDRFSLMLDLSRSELEREDVDYESYAGSGVEGSGPQDTITYNIDPDGEYTIVTALDYTDPSVMLLTDPQGWGQVGFIREPNVEDELNQLRLEGEYDLNRGLFDSLVVGYLYTDREKSYEETAARLQPGIGFGENREAIIPPATRVGVTDSQGLIDIIAYDPSQFIDAGVYVVDPVTPNNPYTIEENINTFYAMLNLDGTVGNTPLRGNVGFQYVDTEQGSTGILDGIGLQTVEYEYSDFLPSLNLNFEVAPDTFLRFAAAQLITRPRLDDLAANQTLSFDGTQSCPDIDDVEGPDTLIGFNPPDLLCFSLNGGNPFLEPYRTTQFDVSFEKYFSPATAFSLAVFYKDLSDWVVGERQFIDGTFAIDARGFGDFLDANPETSLTTFDAPANFAGGDIVGVEATIRLALGDVSPALEGFGTNFSYTYSDGEVSNDGVTIDIPGYSDTVWSGDVYYERFGWRARLSARHRSDYLATFFSFDGALIEETQLEETVVDAQVGYTFEQGPLDGLSLLFEAYNLTDERIGNIQQVPANENAEGTFANRYELYGTTYNFTIAYSF